MLELWQEDHYLSGVKQEFEKTLRPDEKDVYNILRFFLIFSMGCRKLQLVKIADDFEKRANLFITGMNELGFKTRSEIGPNGSTVNSYNVKTMLGNIITSISNQINPDRYL